MTAVIVVLGAGAADVSKALPPGKFHAVVNDHWREGLASSIRTGSVAHLVKVSGIGRKTAEKIVLELKDKMGAMQNGDMSVGMSSDMDAIEALRALGYETDEAREALKKIDKTIEDMGAKVKAALKMLS